MGITERVEQLHRALEAMNAWYATNDDERSASGRANGGGDTDGEATGAAPVAGPGRGGTVTAAGAPSARTPEPAAEPGDRATVQARTTHHPPSTPEPAGRPAGRSADPSRVGDRPPVGDTARKLGATPRPPAPDADFLRSAAARGGIPSAPPQAAVPRAPLTPPRGAAPAPNAAAVEPPSGEPSQGGGLLAGGGRRESGARPSPSAAPAGPNAGDSPRPPLPALLDDLLSRRDGETTPLESATALAESLGLGYHLGSAIERIAAASQQGSAGSEPLREAIWLIERYAALLERRPVGADLHASTARLARTGETIAGIRALSAALETGSAGSAGRERPAAQPDALATPASDVGVEQAERPAAEEPAVTPTAVAAATTTDASPRAEESQSLGHEILFMAARWTIMVVAVVVVVLAVTVIGQWL